MSELLRWHFDRDYQSRNEPYRYRAVESEFPGILSGSASLSQAEILKLQSDSKAAKRPFYLCDWKGEGHGYLIETADKDHSHRIGEPITYDQKQLTKLAASSGRSEEQVLREQGLQSERDFCKRHGIEHREFPCGNHEIPRNSVTQAYDDFLHEVPPNAHVHNHCDGGKARTCIALGMALVKLGRQTILNLKDDARFTLGYNLCKPKRQTYPLLQKYESFENARKTEQDLRWEAWEPKNKPHLHRSPTPSPMGRN